MKVFTKKFLSKLRPAQRRLTLKIPGIWKKRKSENLVIRKQEIQILVTGPLSAQWFFKTWIQLLELLINLIRNASVCSSIILKNLYWSEFGFLVSLWLNFHFFVFFSDSRYFKSEPAHFFLEIKKFGQKWAGSGPAHSEKS